jgi:hypothetical protein
MASGSGLSCVIMVGRRPARASRNRSDRLVLEAIIVYSLLQEVTEVAAWRITFLEAWHTVGAQVFRLETNCVVPSGPSRRNTAETRYLPPPRISGQVSASRRANVCQWSRTARLRFSMNRLVQPVDADQLEFFLDESPMPAPSNGNLDVVRTLPKTFSRMVPESRETTALMEARFHFFKQRKQLRRPVDPSNSYFPRSNISPDLKRHPQRLS